MCVICMKDIFFDMSLEHMEKVAKEKKKEELAAIAGGLKKALDIVKDDPSIMNSPEAQSYKQAQYVISRYL